MNADEPKPRPIAPERPAELSKSGAAEWDRYAPMLERLGLLTEADGDALMMLCDYRARWGELRKHNLENGVTYEALVILDSEGKPVHADAAKIVRRKTPEADLELKYQAIWERLARSFGMLPDSRGRLRVSTGREGEGYDWSKKA